MWLSGYETSAQAALGLQTPAMERRGVIFAALGTPYKDSARLSASLASKTAQRLGFDMSVALFGEGGDRSGDLEAERAARERFFKLFPETGDAMAHRSARERLAKSLIERETLSRSARDPAAPTENAYSETLYPGASERAACVIEASSGRESLRNALRMAFDIDSAPALMAQARASGLTQSDVAFWLYSHEAAHCLYHLLRERARSLDEGWARVEPVASYTGGTDENYEDESPALARAEEISADLWAARMSDKALGRSKAIALMRLTLTARALAKNQDELHDSSGLLKGLLLTARQSAAPLLGQNDQRALSSAWDLASRDTAALARIRALRKPKPAAPALPAPPSRAGAS